MKKSQIIITGLIALAVIAAIALMVSFAQNQEAWKEWLTGFLEIARGTPWALPLVCALFVISGVVLFPVSILNIICAMVFGLWGIGYALIGGMVNTLVFFGVGYYVRHHHGGKKLLDHPRIKPLEQKLQKGGVASAVFLHTLPAPSFSAMNFIGGLSSINFTMFFVGTFIALIPGALARGIVGDSLTKIILHPTPETWAYLGFGLVLWVVLIVATQMALKRFLPEAATT